MVLRAAQLRAQGPLTAAFGASARSPIAHVALGDFVALAAEVRSPRASPHCLHCRRDEQTNSVVINSVGVHLARDVPSPYVSCGSAFVPSLPAHLLCSDGPSTYAPSSQPRHEGLASQSAGCRIPDS